MSSEIVDKLLQELVNMELKRRNDIESVADESKDRFMFLYETSKEILYGMPKRNTNLSKSTIKSRLERITEKLNKNIQFNNISDMVDKIYAHNDTNKSSIIVQFLSWLSLYNNSKSKFSFTSISEAPDFNYEKLPHLIENMNNIDLKKSFNSETSTNLKKKEINEYNMDNDSEYQYPLANYNYHDKVKLIKKRLPKDCLLIADSISLEKPILLESDLLRDMLLVLQSLNGKYIRYDNASGRYLLNHDIKISNSVKELIYKISETGYICRKLNSYITTKSKSCNLVTQGIIFCIKNELLEYSKEVSGWDSLLNGCQNLLSYNINQDDSFHTKNISNCPSQHNHNNNNNTRNNSSLTLRKLYVISREWTKRLIYIYLILEFISGRSSGSKLSGLHKFTYSGDQLCSSVARKILIAAYRPINYILHHFITEGKIKDQYSEFFVSTNKNCNPSLFWKKQFILKAHLIPNFISHDTAHKIFMIGKSIGFIKIIYESINQQTFYRYSSQQIVPNIATIFDPNQLNDENDITKLEKKITPIYIKTSRILLDLVVNHLHFNVHLKAINDYLLLGRGDFILYLMETIVQNDKGNKFLSHNIAALLETTIRSTTAQFDPPDVIQRIDCRIYDNRQCNNKFELFTLDYRVDGPLSTIFSRKAMKCYRNIFSFLWKIKHLETCLSRIWYHHFSLRKNKQYFLLKNFPPVTSEMLYFINQLQYYIMFEVIECHRNILMSKLSSATDLDMILFAHRNYLQQIMNYCFLDSNYTHVNTILNGLFNCIYNFNELYLSMIQQSTDNMTQNETVLLNTENINNILASLHEIHHFYKRNMNEFVKFLSNYPDFIVRSLGFRINFNNFYE